MGLQAISARRRIDEPRRTESTNVIKPLLTSKARLIVVTGRPGSGKTTLAHTLAKAIHCPLISRDEIKEGLVNTTGTYQPAIDAITAFALHRPAQ